MGSFHLSNLYIVVENQKFFAYKHKSVVFHRVLFEKLKSVQFWRTKRTRRTQRTLKKMYALKKKCTLLYAKAYNMATLLKSDNNLNCQINIYHL